MDFSGIQKKAQLEDSIRSLTIKFDTAEGSDKWEIEDLLLNEKKELNKLRRSKGVTTSKAISANDLITDVKNRPTIPRYSTGIQALDEALSGGIEIGSFVQLAGSSFAGKTHLAIEILSSVANHKKVMFFNFEMGDRRIANRFDKSLHTQQARNNMLIHNSDRELSNIVSEILHGIKQGIRFFAIDSKMKIELASEKDDYKRFTIISATLSKLTQEHEIIIFLINQISEDDDKTGRLAFKGSGDQLYDTDLALFYKIDKDDLSYRTLACRKNRQDENNFTINLELQNGKTVRSNKGTKEKSEQPKYIRSGVPVHESTYQMPVIGA